MTKNPALPSESTFKKLTREVVKEELAPFRKEFNNNLNDFRKEFNSKLDNFKNEFNNKLTDFKFDILKEFEKISDRQSDKIQKLTNQILTSEDKIMGELKTAREEREILSVQHHRIIDHEERLEKLEKVFPQL